MTDPLLHHALAATVEARIAGLWAQERRDRRGPYRAVHSPARYNRLLLLRELLALRRSAKRLAREAVEREDAMTAAKAYRELGYHAAQAAYREPSPATAGPITEAELWGGYGGSDDAGGGIAGEPPDLNREGEPAFNGAFSRW